MINVCEHCGSYRADKRIELSGPDAICPDCGHAHRFVCSPLLIVSGASGAGKTRVCGLLTGVVTRAVLLDVDILWRREFIDPSNHADFFETWLRMAKNIAQSRRPVVLFGAGFGVPGNIEPCIERRYFSAVHYLALTCADEDLRERLRARPEWRGSGQAAFVEPHSCDSTRGSRAMQDRRRSTSSTRPASRRSAPRSRSTHGSSKRIGSGD